MKSPDYAQHISNKALENCRIGRWHYSSFLHSIMALSSILGLRIMYLFPDAQEKPALALCIVAILPRVIVLRNKVTIPLAILSMPPLTRDIGN